MEPFGIGIGTLRTGGGIWSQASLLPSSVQLTSPTPVMTSIQWRQASLTQSTRSKHLVVGAPKGESQQVGTTRAGAVYSCNVNTYTRSRSRGDDRWCQYERVEYDLSNIDTEGDPYSKPPNETRNHDGGMPHFNGKTGQLLGAAIATSGTADSKVVVCAPLLRYNEVAYTLGTCHVLNNDFQYNSQKTTCNVLDKTDRHNRFGSCLEGVSASYSELGDMVLTGLPGSENWIGGVTATAMAGRRSLARFSMYDSATGREVTQRDVPTHSYLGMSIKSGWFGFGHEPQSPNDRMGGNITIVAGATRLKDDGAVMFFGFSSKFNILSSELLLLNNKFMLKGEMMTAGFGYSLEVVDLNADGFDDLLVGAPYQYEKDADGWHMGAVYVYFSRGKHQDLDSNDMVFHEPIKLLGAPTSQFGSSITKLNDINKDGFNDFAIGAPFEGQGVVYIYHGSARGDFSKKPAQVIRGSDLTSNPPLSAFGFSLAGGADMDDNEYPDLLVGDFMSNAVVLLRSRPIIKISVEIFDVDTIDKDKPCKHLDRTAAATCVSFKTKVNKRKDEDSFLQQSNKLTCRLEVVPFQAGIPKRGFIDRIGEEHEVKEWDCKMDGNEDAHNLIVPTNVRNFLDPLKLKFSVGLSNDRQPTVPQEGGQLPDLNQYPMLDQKGSSQEVAVNFDKKCGADDLCETDLVVRCVFEDLPQREGVYILSVDEKTDSLNLVVSVRNIEEHAYDSNLYVTFDEQELERPTLNKQKSGVGVNLGEFVNGVASVQLGNPMIKDSQTEAVLQFKLARGKSESLGRNLIFNVTVNSTSQEQVSTNNFCVQNVKVIKNAELVLQGKSQPELVQYAGPIVSESNMKYEEDIGPNLKHYYTVTNKGPWGVGNVTVVIDFPYEIQSEFPKGKWALYLMEKPLWNMRVPGQKAVKIRSCSLDQTPVGGTSKRVNPLGVKVNTFHSLRADLGGNTVEGGLLKRKKREARPEARSGESVTEAQRALRTGRIKAHSVVEDSGEMSSVVTVGCNAGTAKCFPITCRFPYLDKGVSAAIEIRARLWSSTFVEDYPRVTYVSIESNGRIEIDATQGVQENSTDNNFDAAVTQAYPDLPTITPQAIPWWVFAIAVAIGIFLLLLIVLCCWKCGFFRRKKQQPTPLYQAEYQHVQEQWEGT